LNRTRTLLAACALALPIPAAIAGCGGDDGGDEDPQEVLSATFNNDNTISSGVIDLSLEASAEGAAGGNFAVNLSGPFQGDPENPTAIPQLDMTASVSGEGGGQSLDFEGGLVVTEDNAFVEYDGSAYEVGTETFTQLKEQAEAQAGAAEDSTDASSSFREGCESAIEAQGGDPAACDFDVSAWFTELSNEGTEDKGGSEATHIAGQLDIATMLNDLFQLGASVPGANVQGLSPEVIQSQLDTVANAVETADFDVYSATEDDTLRGLDFTIAIDPAAIPGGEAAGVESVDLSFAMEISDADEEQTIEAPSDAKPLSELQGELGGLGIPGVGGTVPGLTPGGTGIPDAGAGTGDPALDCLAEAQTQKEITECLNQS
jgi:hypothetical protein